MSVNPLQQYFRRPAIYLKLPSNGVGYKPDSIVLPDNGELPVYPMTAIDEITSRTPDALYNGNAVVELIKSCVPNIKDPWDMPAIDLDPILVAIRIATSGDTMEIDTACPACSEEAKYDINLTGILASFSSGDYNTPLTIGDLSIKFKPLAYRDLNTVNMKQFEVQRMLLNMEKLTDDDPDRMKKSSEMIKGINSIATKMIANTVEYIKTPTSIVLEKEFIIEFLENCDKQTFETIRDTGVKLREKTESKPLQMKCIHCSHEYKQPFTINVTDFFG